MLDVIMININIEEDFIFSSAKFFRPERQMTASSSTRPQTWRPTWRATWSPATSSTMNSITFRRAQTAMRAHKRRAKIKMKPAQRRDSALRERPAALGHTHIGDHISAPDLSLDQVDLKLGITLLDAGTLFGDLIGVSSKNVNDTIMAFREFYGEDLFYYFHSHNAKGFQAAAGQELMVYLTSTPHRPDSNGVVERVNQLIVDGDGSLLLQSVLPGRYWHHACRAFPLARNACVKGKDGRTAWDRRFDKKFHGKLLPFGPKVIYRRPKQDTAKFAPSGSEGIRLGHHLEPSGLFKSDYLVLSLDNLLVEDRAKSSLHCVKEIVRAPEPNA